jgi:hypothetical protein
MTDVVDASANKIRPDGDGVYDAPGNTMPDARLLRQCRSKLEVSATRTSRPPTLLIEPSLVTARVLFDAPGPREAVR